MFTLYEFIAVNMVWQLHAQPAFADRFLTHVLTRNIRIEERKLGFIDYNGGLKIDNSLLSVVLRDGPPTKSHGGARSPSLGAVRRTTSST